MSDHHQPDDDIQNKSSMDVAKIGLRESSPLPSTSTASFLKKDASKPLKSNLPPSLSLISKKDNSLLFQNRSKRCDKCVGCKSSSCGICIYCVDSQKYGGPGVKKQSCVERKCLIVLKSRVEREITKFKARVGCNDCVDCNFPDCKSCLSCLDKKFFGGSYTKNSLCTKKKCTNSTFLKLPCQKQQQIHHRNIKKKATLKRKIKSQNVNGIEKAVIKQGRLEAPSSASVSPAPNIPHQKRMKKTEKKVADGSISAPNNVKVDQPQFLDSQLHKLMPPPLAYQNLEFDDPRIKILQSVQTPNIPKQQPGISQKRKKIDRTKLTPLLIPSSKNIDLKQIFDKIAFEESSKLIIQQQPEGKQQQQTTMMKFPINLNFFETPKTSIAQKLRPLNISINYDTPDCAKILEENGSALKILPKKRGRKPKKLNESEQDFAIASQTTPMKILPKIKDQRQTKIKNVLDLNTKNEIQIQEESKIQQPQPKQQPQQPKVLQIELSKIPNTSSIAKNFWHYHFQNPSCLQQQPLSFYPKPLPPHPSPRPSQINQKTNEELKATTSTRTPQTDPINAENIPWSLTSQNVYPRFNQINGTNKPYYFNNFYESPMSRSARFQFYNPIFSSQDPLLPPSYAGKDQIVLESL